MGQSSVVVVVAALCERACRCCLDPQEEGNNDASPCAMEICSQDLELSPLKLKQVTLDIDEARFYSIARQGWLKYACEQSPSRHRAK